MLLFTGYRLHTRTNWSDKLVPTSKDWREKGLGENILELKGISKSFGNNQVLHCVDFSLLKGEVHAVIGENGAGKSTLMNIAYGLVHPEQGEILIDGQKTEVKNPSDAHSNGICFVHQEIALCPELTVAENIFMSKINAMKTLNINYSKLNKEAAALLSRITTDIAPNEMVANLTISNQQVVEIAKALSTECKVLILDEPTASLSESEAEALYEIMRKLKAEGIGIIYISHRLSEIFEQCDRVSVLRDGCMINTYKVNDVKPEQLVNDMAGREISCLYPPKNETLDYAGGAQPMLSVKNLSDKAGAFCDISFDLYKGEILGFSGLIGSGRSEIMEGVVGLRKKKAGQVLFKDRDISGYATKDIFDTGLLYLSEDRKSTGLFLDLDIKQNISAVHLSTIVKNKVISQSREKEQAEKLAKSLRIKCSGVGQVVRSLSGGNQQKVLIGKLLTRDPQIVIMDEPTRGIDIGAKSEIHALLRQLANQGVGVIVVSSELNEIIGMCDRVLVMHEGHLCTEVKQNEISSTAIMHYASGAYKLQNNEGESLCQQ